LSLSSFAASELRVEKLELDLENLDVDAEFLFRVIHLFSRHERGRRVGSLPRRRTGTRACTRTACGPSARTGGLRAARWSKLRAPAELGLWERQRGSVVEACAETRQAELQNHVSPFFRAEERLDRHYRCEVWCSCLERSIRVCLCHIASLRRSSMVINSAHCHVCMIVLFYEVGRGAKL